jgi:hypothetical protein
MGQQQLLLIILAVLIIGIAIAIGVSLFTAQSVESNRDSLITDIENINAHAYEYYNRPVSIGGGGGTVVGYRIPSKMATNENGVYVASGATATQITITGTSIDGNGTITNTFNAVTGQVVGPYTFTGVFAQ